MSAIIKVEELSKSYRLGQIGGGTLTEDLNRWWARLRKRPDPYTKIGQEERSRRRGEIIWALREVNFSVDQGEVLGIIGPNGAGKSTLLKILSRVTAPTSGEVKLKGRVASLLEVGTGFHPDLTGRENVYLNGAILGMTRRETARKFDEIVDFSGVEKFIDTPVKRYSSGMYVRLAFAVAAHLEPEILIVDEVLAVGDVAFQNKCLGKMNDISRSGKTVLFVSHNMASIRSLCQKTILLQAGCLTANGLTDNIVDEYLSIIVDNKNETSRHFGKPIGKKVWIDKVSILRNGKPERHFKMGDRITIEIYFKSSEGVIKPSIGYLISSIKGDKIINANTIYQNSPVFPEIVTSGRIMCKLGSVPFMQDQYIVSLWLGDDTTQVFQYIENAITFEVLEKDIWGKGKLPTRGLSSLWWSTEFSFEFNPLDM